MSDSKTILVTGGTGYIGSHCVVELLNQGDQVVIIDNLMNSSVKVLDRIQTITNKTPIFHEIDLCDADALDAVFAQHQFDAVIHFAGLKAVGESSELPMLYYRNNLVSTMNLLDAMQAHEVYQLVFSSSATVYGDNNQVPYDESMPTSATNPYGQTKLMIEQFLMDAFAANSQWNIVALRYFNPVGAHPSGLMGEDPKGIPNNLIPYIAQVAVGRREQLQVFGGDYDTVDGTGVRDYLHVTDLVLGHVRALDYLYKQTSGYQAVNLGTGKGTSVVEMVDAFKAASGKPIPYKIVARRPGDLAEVYANTDKASQMLGWTAACSLEDMCVDTWNWQQKNPQGYV